MEGQNRSPQEDRGLAEVVKFNGEVFAEVIRKGSRSERSVFISPADSSMQLGVLSHAKGFIETPHYHKKIKRTIEDLQQLVVVQKGVAEVDFFGKDGGKLGSVKLNEGDAILLKNGAHSLKALSDLQCLSLKQGPFMGEANDKVEI